MPSQQCIQAKCKGTKGYFPIAYCVVSEEKEVLQPIVRHDGDGGDEQSFKALALALSFPPPPGVACGDESQDARAENYICNPIPRDGSSGTSARLASGN
jgi:hypothetical protein